MASYLCSSIKYPWCGAEISIRKLHRIYCMNEGLNHCYSTTFVTWMVCFSTDM